MASYSNSREHVSFARQLRKSSPLSERILWKALHALKKAEGIKFRRQHPLHPYIADFACVPVRLIVELDGLSHENAQIYDKKRTEYLMAHGWTVVRYGNDDVLHNLEGIVEEILQKVRRLQAAPP